MSLILGLLVASAAASQEAPKKKKKAPAVKAHQKPTPEQIRKFNELQKKQQ
jgi:hypothetical protein